MVAPVVFSSGCRNMVGHAVSFDTVSRDAQTLNLSRNVSKFYAGQVVSLINEQPSQNLLLKVDPLSTIRNELIAKAKGEELETSAVRVFVSNTSSPRLKRRYTRYVFLFLVFCWL